MKFGVREICDVVLRAKSAMKIGNKVFYKNEPVLYFDTLKTSALENTTNTVYAQGGRGNARLIAWEGEKTVTFTMEDALISPMGLSVLTGAGLIKAEDKPIIVHKTEITNAVKKDGQTGAGNHFDYYEITLKEQPYKVPSGWNKVNSSEDFIYVMLLDDNGEIISEPYIASETFERKKRDSKIFLTEQNVGPYQSDDYNRKNDLSKFYDGCQVLVDYYTEVTEKAYQVNITPDNFSGNFYLEASTLFRASNGVDMPAEFIIPNCKIQSNFTFTMASSGDPTTFNFTIDAFPDYTRWNKDKKVFAAIQVIEDNNALTNFERLGTPHDLGKAAIGKNHSEPYATYLLEQAPYIEDNIPIEIKNMIFDSIEGENEEIYNDGLGYKTNTSLITSSGPGYNVLNEQDDEGYTVTGYIPYSYGQNIHIAGLKPENNSSSKQKIYFCYNAKGAMISSEEGSYLLNLQGENDDVVYNPIKNHPDNFDSSLTSVKYIRICFYNTNIKEMAVFVSGNPTSPEEQFENNIPIVSLLFNSDLDEQSDDEMQTSNNDEEETTSPEEEVSNLVDEDLDMSDIISLLEEEEEEE